MNYLLEPSSMPVIEGIKIPSDLYWVLSDPAPLAGMQEPYLSAPSWDRLFEAGFTHVVNLIDEQPLYDPSPLKVAFSAKLEDLVSGGPPGNPEKELERINQAVEIVHSLLISGDGVIVHCWGGRGRTGTVLGCVLRKLGYEAESIISALDNIHKARGREGWPESPWQAEVVRTA